MRAIEFLIEDRVDYLAQQMGDKIMSAYERDTGFKPEFTTPLEVVRYLSRASVKDINWIVRQYVKGKFRLEDIPMIAEEIRDFKRIRPRLPKDQRDLNKLTLRKLYDITDNFTGDVLSNREIEQMEKSKFYSPNESKVIYKSNRLVVLIPKTEEASCFFGKGTKWCTAGHNNNMFDFYNKEGPLYIIMTKDMGKFQFHFKSNQFMNSRDEELSMEDFHELLEKYPELYSIFETEAYEYLYLPLIKDPTEDVQIMAVRKHPYFIRGINNPTEKVQLAAVERTGDMIKYIENPTKKVQRVAVSNHGDAIRYIKDQDPELQELAVRNSAYAIKHIKYPIPRVQIMAIKHDLNLIRWIENPAPETQMVALELDPGGQVLQYLDYVDDAVQIKAVENDPKAIYYITDPCETAQLIAVKKWPWVIDYLDYPSPRVVKLYNKLKQEKKER